MASEHMSLPVNGVPTQPAAYGMTEQEAATHASASGVEYGSSNSNAIASNSGANSEIPKDEVGWYFVEQYYTTLSKNPDKLYLFYNKRSQYVSGDETEKVPVCVGQKAINDRIKSHKFSDCKVRVNNVDSQGSGPNIVIQVIGEMSLSNQTTTRRFTQTFILAEQTNGYFVLNDIFRYLLEGDEEDEPPVESAPPAQVEAASGHQEAGNTSVQQDVLADPQNATEREQQAALVDQGLQEAINEPSKTADPEPAVANGAVHLDPPAVIKTEETPADATTSADDVPVSTNEAMEMAEAEDFTAEKPQDPEPTPAVASPVPAPAQPTEQAASTKPSAPKSWASMVAGGKVALPAAAAANAQLAPSSTSSQPKAAAPPAVQTQPTTATSLAQDVEQPATPQSSGSEWQTTHRDHGKKQARPQQATQNVPDDNSRSYIKHVSESVDADMLRNALSKFGELLYVDINRQKSCAFADFKTSAGYQAAVAANPHEIGGTRIVVEERRIRPASMGGFAPRGGPMNRGGRGNFDGRPTQGRGGFQRDGARGGYPNRGRGNPNGRGRGVPQPAGA
ncbi:MAG: hypothetical protein M1828_002990 [Chrysothrix sp. TS-e1954]|nr:MAG: hypothetical protein M1828_002990 [Chrysothrix sp. TS-e1954]